MDNPLKTQVGGDHYKNMPLQPVEICHKNKLDFFQGCILKYIFRHKFKNKRQDLEKAKHFLEIYMNLEYPGPNTTGYKTEINPVEILRDSSDMKLNPYIGHHLDVDLTPPGTEPERMPGETYNKLNPGEDVKDFDKNEEGNRERFKRRLEVNDILEDAENDYGE